MNIRKLLSLSIVGIGLILAAFSYNLSTAHGQEEIPGDPERGGRLYAGWDLVLGFTNFESRQPLWGNNPGPPISDRITWRCVSCHGWDYRGSEGRLPYPWMQKDQDNPSLLSLMGNPPDKIMPWLDGTNNPDHDFSEYLSTEDLNDLSLFISNTLVAPDLIATTDNNEVQGTTNVGHNVYTDYCQSCHGSEGEKINFGSTDAPSFLGDQAWSNPWRIAHIVRSGHLIGNVPPASSLGISFSQQIDLLAHLQTLPRARMIASAENQNIDFSTQASTLPLVYGSIALALLIFAAVSITRYRAQ